MTEVPTIGIVVIGRNEGDRLKQCLRSMPDDLPIVYVDSGSTDESVDFARSIGVNVIELDMTIPFTAARARNAGWRHLREKQSNIEFIQFVDGDCEIHQNWLRSAEIWMRSEPQLGVVFGRLRERFPHRSIYNRMCDHEWDVPVGVADHSGGNVMIRVLILHAVGGFNDALIAGEEPDLCLRIRKRGFIVRRINCEMGLHDAAMYSWRAWWRRSQRSGFAYANFVWDHRKNSDRSWMRQICSILIWATMTPSIAILGVIMLAYQRAIISIILATFVIFLYIIQFSRMFARNLSEGHDRKFAFAHSVLILIGKIPQFIGLLMFFRSRLLRRSQVLIEYKDE